MKIVQFEDGTYGIKRGWWIFADYLTTSYYTNNFFVTDEYIYTCCRFNSLEEAKERLEHYINYSGHGFNSYRAKVVVDYDKQNK